MVSEADYEFGPGARHAAFNVVRALPRGKSFGNAREMRRLLDAITGRHAELLAGREGITATDLKRITAESVPEPEHIRFEFVEVPSS
jgi:hypothetical protein